MKIDKQEVQKVARLARLALSDQEVALYQGQLSQILEYVDQLRAVDTKGVAPTAQVTGQVNRLGDDKVQNKPQPNLLVDTPATDGNSIKVKGVFDG